MLIGANSEANGLNLIEHCEKYLFTYSGEIFSVIASELNNLEKGMSFDYLFFKMTQKVKESGGGFFPHEVFLVMITSMVYKILKDKGNPEDIQTFAETITVSMDKVWKLRNWHEAGEPKDDENLIKEMEEVIAISQKANMEEIMAMFQRLQKGNEN